MQNVVADQALGEDQGNEGELPENPAALSQGVAEKRAEEGSKNSRPPPPPSPGPKPGDPLPKPHTHKTDDSDHSSKPGAPKKAATRKPTVHVASVQNDWGSFGPSSTSNETPAHSQDVGEASDRVTGVGETAEHIAAAPAQPNPAAVLPTPLPVHSFHVNDLETFMYYHRMVSFYTLPSHGFEDGERKYIKVDGEEKVLLGDMDQDVTRKYGSFKLHRALAYTGDEQFGFKPWCYSFSPAAEPSKYLVSIRDMFLTVRTISEHSPQALKEAASFCVVDKKDGNSRNDAVSISTWSNETMIWRAVGEYMSLGKYVKHRHKSFTPKSATFVVSQALFNGQCHNGTEHRCTCSPGYVGVNCHTQDCVAQDVAKTSQCSEKGVCLLNKKQCACSSKYFGYDCQYTKCPKWGPLHAERSCNNRGYCNIRTGKCACDKGWSGDTCEQGKCKDNCNGRGNCDTASGTCTCNKLYWGASCEKKKCAHFYPSCSKQGNCLTAGDSQGKCECQPGFYGNACQHKSCPVKDCNKNGYCDNVSGKCKCFVHYFGPGCGNKNCPNGCGGNGKCDWRTGTCKCNQGWGLTDCSERVCPKGCSGRGKCNQATGTCDCLGHSFGEGCESTCPGKCNERGRCNQKTGKCECAGDFFGLSCEKANCKNNCFGRGECDLTTGKCQCNSEFSNADCSVRRCLNDCNHNGKCVGDASSSKCQCNFPFFGSTCKLKKCPRNCGNSGVCDFNRGVCRCMTGYTGVDCMQKTCIRSCSNRGKCSFGTCQCLKPFSGAACEYADCKVKCGSHGSCDHTEGKCKCEGLWTGQTCTERKCPNDCNGHGQCSPDGTCVCLPKWYGEDCSKHKCDDKCVNGLCDPKTGRCNCQPGFFTKDCSKKACSGPSVTCSDTECNCGLTGEKSKCDYKVGQCKCLPNLSRAEYFFSTNCEKRKCPGECDEAEATCSCSGHGNCDYKTGKCACSEGFEGNSCAFFPARDSLEMSFNLKDSIAPSDLHT